MANVIASDCIYGVHHLHLCPQTDERGAFVEVYRRQWLPGSREMLQSNCSISEPGVLRGMHFHRKQADYWVVFSGLLFVALFDFRSNSPTFRRLECFEIGSADPDEIVNRALFIPPGVVHGFQALTRCTLTYLVDAYYDAHDEHGIAWNDPDMNVQWPDRHPLLSKRDCRNAALRDTSPCI